MSEPIRLGDKVRDKVSGFEGTAVAKLEFMNGCIQYQVRPAMKKGDKEIPKGELIDQQQLEVTGKRVEVKPKPTGGDQPDAPVLP